MTSLTTNKFQVDFDSSNQELLEKTIYGESCVKSLDASRKEMGCRFLTKKDRVLRKQKNRG